MKKKESKSSSYTEFGGKENRFRVSKLQMALARDDRKSGNKPKARRGAYGFHAYKTKGGKRVPTWLA